MIDISCSKLNKTYVADKILDNLDFSINEFEKVGLIGLNGSGKTTLFKILTSEIDYDSGNFYINKSKKFGYLNQEDVYEDTDTVLSLLETVFTDIMIMEKKLRFLEIEMSKNYDNSKKLESIMDEYSKINDFYEKNNGYSYKSRIRGVLFGLGFSEDEFNHKIIELSGGQKNRIALAKLLLLAPEILFLDEPTNHLDIKSVEWLEKYIKDFKGTALIISHDRYFLDSVTTKTFYLNNSKITTYNGNYSYFINKRNADLELELKKYILQEKEILRQKEIINKFLSNGRDKKVRQAKSREKMLENIQLVQSPDLESKKMNFRFNPNIESGNEVLSVRSLSKYYGEKKVFENIDFQIYKGDKIGLIGPNGVGKSTLIKIIQGLIKKNSGEFTLGHNVNIGYYDQELSTLNAENSVFDEIWDEYPELKVHELRSYLAKFMFYNEDIFKTVNDLSGGEKSRLSLLKLMLSNDNFLLMDEPTNHLDIDSKNVLEKTIKNYTGTILIISHDRYFLNKTVTKIFDMDSDQITEYLGDYDYYSFKKNSQLVEEDIENIETKTELKNKVRKERKVIKERQKTKKIIEDYEQSILKIESELLILEEKLCSPEIYNNHILSNELSSQIDFMKKDLENIYEEWNSLHE